MNRKERRAKGIKNSDPTIVLKQSDVGNYLKNLVRQDLSVRKAIQEEAERISTIELNKTETDMDTLILMSLHKLGFGRTRLLRFAKILMDLREAYKERYEDCDTFAMRKHLLESTGINVEKLREEVEKFATEEDSNKR